MSAPQLNVRVGLLFDEKSLANLERQMRSSGQRLSKIGTDLTLSLSLPLAAFGVSAIQAAGDIESLTLALKSQLGTADAAAKELDNLTKSALKPGIGLEQAVRGSVRLQGIGLSADEARKTIEEMGNAIASTGGGAQELDGVTKQFAQIISKGRLLQEDVSILSENMPAIAGLMQKAFGTTSVEAIRNMGVSGKEFVLQITKMAEGLPRVEGGIKNGIGNAIDSLKQSAAKVGFAINEAFDVTGAIESVSSAVLALAQGFSGLDPGIKSTVLSFAGLAIAIGPILKGYGAIKIFNSQLVGGWASLVGVGNSLIGTTNKYADVLDKTAVSTSRMEGALSRVKLAFGIIGIVVGLAIAIDQLSEGFSAAEFASEKFAQAQKDIIAETSKEIGTVNQLFAAIKDETKGKGEKGDVIQKLLKLYPEYFKGMDLEGASVAKLTSLQNGLNSSILRGVAERKKADAVNSIYEKQAEILTRITQIREGSAVSVSESALINTGDMIRAGGIAGAVILKLEQQTKDLTAQVAVTESQFDKTFGTVGKTFDPILTKEYALLDAYYAEKDAHQMGIVLTKEETKVRELSAEAIEKQKNKLKTLKEVLDDVKNASIKAGLIGDDSDEKKIDALRKGIEKLIDAGFKPASAEVLNLKTQLDALKGSVVSIDVIKRKGNIPGVVSQTPTAAPTPNPVVPPENIDASVAAFTRYADSMGLAFETQKTLADGTFNFVDGLSGLSESLLQNGDLIGSIFTGMGDAIAQSAAQGETSFKSLGQAAAGAAAKIVRAYIQQGVAAAVAKALGSSIPFPFNIAAGAAAGGVAAALFTKAIGSIGVKGFARGTSFAPGGTALVGEQGPELINLPRGSQVFPTPKTNAMLSGMGGGNMNVSGEFTVRGTDLVLVLDRTNNKNERFR